MNVRSIRVNIFPSGEEWALLVYVLEHRGAVPRVVAKSRQQTVKYPRDGRLERVLAAAADTLLDVVENGRLH